MIRKARESILWTRKATELVLGQRNLSQCLSVGVIFPRGVTSENAWRLILDRIFQAVGDARVADNIRTALLNQRVERWVVHTDPHGGVSVAVIDASGKFVMRPELVSKIAGK